MTTREIIALVEGGIPFFAGLYATLIGFRKIGKQPGEDPAYDAKYEKFVKHLKWLGPFLMAWGIIYGIMKLYGM